MYYVVLLVAQIFNIYCSEQDSTITSSSSFEYVGIDSKSSARTNSSLSPKGSPSKIARKRSVDLDELRRQKIEKEKIIKEHHKSSSDYALYRAALQTAKQPYRERRPTLVEREIKDALEESEGYSEKINSSYIKKLGKRAVKTAQELQADEEKMALRQQELELLEQQVKRDKEHRLVPALRDAAELRAKEQRIKQEKKEKRKQRQKEEQEKHKQRVLSFLKLFKKKKHGNHH
jgi:hypothetical protein